ncbi:hypothetical protein K0M31_018574, partial [Melipona bicolor]
MIRRLVRQELVDGLGKIKVPSSAGQSRRLLDKRYLRYSEQLDLIEIATISFFAL